MKRNKKIVVVSMLLIGALSITSCSSGNPVQTDSQNVEVKMEGAENTEKNTNLAIRVTPEEEHYIFELNDDVTREHVYYKNRFGVEIAGDLYTPKDMDTSKKYTAIIVGAPFGGVKEQGPGVYANELASRGFVVLTFDPAYHGYSGGEVRMAGSSAMYVEDFSAGVDYLGTQSFVDRDKIATIGICGSGGFALSAAAQDTRIKAVVPVVMYDIAGNMNSMEGEMRTQMLDMMSQQRWVDVENGTSAYRTSYPTEPVAEIPEGLDPVTEEFFMFYGMERGHHPNALGNITDASMADIMNLPTSTHIDEISPRPILFIAGENAHSLVYSQDTYEKVSEPKELYIVEDANHIDLYDQVGKIPFDKIESFLNEALN